MKIDYAAGAKRWQENSRIAYAAVQQAVQDEMPASAQYLQWRAANAHYEMTQYLNALLGRVA